MVSSVRKLSIYISRSLVSEKGESERREDRLEADLKIFVCMFPDKQPLLHVGGPVVRKALDASRFADSVAEVADDNPGEEPQIRELTIAGILFLHLIVQTS